MMTRSIVLRAINLACMIFGAGMVLGLAHCRPSQDGESSFPRSETLYIGGLRWGEPTSFNPLQSEPSWPVPAGEGFYNVLYESLLLFNSETGKIQPALAESFTVG